MNYNFVCNPIVPEQKIGKDENGAKVDVTLYKQIVRCLIYLTATRPDLMFVVSLISHFMTCPTQQRFAVAKRVLGSIDYGVFYKKGGVSDLIGLLIVIMPETWKITRVLQAMSGGAVAWSSRKQPIVTLSTTVAKFVVVIACAYQAVWRKRMLKEIGHKANV